MKHYKYIIIGAGVSGLYLGNLIKDNYLIIEKNNYIGGRALTYNFNGTNVSLGAGIIRETDKHLLTLLKKLDIKVKKFRSRFHFEGMEQFIKSKDYNEEKLYKLFNFMIKQIKNVYEVHRNEIKTKGYTFLEFLNLFFSTEFNEIFMNCTLHLDWFYADVEKTILEYPLEELLIVKPLYYYYIEGGWKELIDKLSTKIIKNIILNDAIVKIIKCYNKYECITGNGNIYSCDKLIICADLSIANIECVNFDFKILNSQIGSVEFMRCFSYHDKINLKYNIKTNSILDKIIKINDNILMSCYNDNYKSKITKRLLNSKENINRLLCKYDISKTKDFISAYWKHGIHYYRPNSNITMHLSEYEKNGIYFIGEMVSNNQGWVEGAIESVNINIHKLFN